MGTVLCTHKRDFATVTLIPGRCFDQGGGGYRILQQSRGGAKLQHFFRSPLDQKEAIGVVFRSMDPHQAILEPRRVRVTLILGSTLPFEAFCSCSVRLNLLQICFLLCYNEGPNELESYLQDSA